MTLRIPHINEPISGDGGKSNDNWHRFLGDAAQQANETAAGLAALSSVADSRCALIEYPSDKDYVIWRNIPFAITVTSVTRRTNTGSLTLTPKKNTTAITGTSGTANTTEATGTATADNAFAIGDDLRLTVSAVSSAGDLEVTVNYTRSIP